MDDGGWASRRFVGINEVFYRELQLRPFPGGTGLTLFTTNITKPARTYLYPFRCVISKASISMRLAWKKASIRHLKLI